MCHGEQDGPAVGGGLGVRDPVDGEHVRKGERPFLLGAERRGKTERNEQGAREGAAEYRYGFHGVLI